METRPKIKIALNTSDKIVEYISLVLLLLIWSIILYSYNKLPEIIPTHFNGKGAPDGYGNKISIIMLPVIATIIFTAISALNKHPHIFNYATVITADNAERQYRTATKMLRYLKLSVMVIFTFIVFSTSLIGMGYSTELGSWFLPFTLAVIFIPSIIFVIKSLKAK